MPLVTPATSVPRTPSNSPKSSSEIGSEELWAGVQARVLPYQIIHWPPLRVEHVGLAVAVEVAEAQLLHRHGHGREVHQRHGPALQETQVAAAIPVEHVGAAVVVDVGEAQFVACACWRRAGTPRAAAAAREEPGGAVGDEDVGLPIAIEVAGGQLQRVVGVDTGCRSPGMFDQRRA